MKLLAQARCTGTAGGAVTMRSRLAERLRCRAALSRGLDAARPWTGHNLPKTAARASVVVRAAGDDEDEPFDANVFYGEMSFGKPSAPTEIWQGYRDEARNGFMAEMSKDAEDVDVLLACLHVAAEDDAVHTNAIVQLPVEPYIKRVNKLADELAAFHLPPKGSPAEESLAAVEKFIFETSKYSLAEAVLERYSPYRMYLHNVVAQRVGTKTALGVLMCAVLRRLQEINALDFEAEVMMPVSLAKPFLRAKGGESDRVGVAMNGKALVLQLLDDLKRSYWAWEWDVNAESGFLQAALAAVGATGRMGTANGTTGVIQPTGRPFGDLTRSLLQTERLALAGGPAFHFRDASVLLYHMSRPEEAYDAMKAYASATGGGGLPQQGDGSAQREDELAQNIMDKLHLMVAESSLLKEK